MATEPNFVYVRNIRELLTEKKIDPEGWKKGLHEAGASLGHTSSLEKGAESPWRCDEQETLYLSRNVMPFGVCRKVIGKI